MTDSYKEKFDIFVCGGSDHVSLLKPLLGRLQPYGMVHLASCIFTDADLDELRGLYDVLHRPRHSDDGYGNFELFCIRDINGIATAPYFIKLDADIELSADWITYVEDCVAADPDAVLFGPRKGNVDITLDLSGDLVRRLLGQDIQVEDALKVIGGFYVGKTAFFKEHARFMNLLHELLWCFKDGVRDRPSPNTGYWTSDGGEVRETIKVVGPTDRFPKSRQ